MRFRYMALKTLMVMAAVSSLIACGKSNDGRTTTRGADGASVVTAQMSTCSNGQSAVGYVYSDTGDLTTSVQELVSATINPQFFGEVSGTPGGATGVDLRMRIKVVNGQINAAATSLQLVIYDSNVGTASTANPGQTVQPYPITMTSATQVSNSQILFRDQYGTIIVNITNSDSQSIRGTIEFQNSANVVGGQPYSDTLGSFILPACVLSN